MLSLRVQKFKYDVLISNLIILFLVILSPSFAQDNSLYKALPQENLQKIKLLTERDHVQIGELIRFTLTPESLSKSFEFKLTYGDRTDDIKKIGTSSILHGFSTAGSFTVSVWPATGEHFYPLDSITIQVDSVELTINPENVFVGQDVKISTKFETTYRVVFRFFSNDDLPLSDWSNSPVTNYKFLNEGTYTIYAKIGQRFSSGVSQIVSSIKREVRVLPITINLTADKRLINVNDSVTFSVSTNPENKNFKYLFNFDDQTREKLTADSTIKHTFLNPGNYDVNVQLFLDNKILTYRATVNIRVDPSIPPILTDTEVVQLSADKNNILTGNIIVFTATTNNQRSGLTYLFYTGDRNKPVSTLKDTIHYAYSDSGNYIAYVQVTLNGNLLATSLPINITIGSEGSSESDGIPAWLFVISGLAVVAVSYKIKTKPKGSKWWLPFNSSFHVFSKPGTVKLADEKKFAVNFEFRLKPNLSESRYQLNVNEPNLIKTIRREK
jgi:hypothetical protein